MSKRILLVVLLVLALDQLVKVYIKLNFSLGEHISLINGLIELHFIENKGMAFGLELPGQWGKIILSLFRIGAVVVIGLYLKKIAKAGAHKGFVTCIALILAGAIGNIIDSAIYGVLFSASGFGQVAEFMPASGGYAAPLLGNVVDMLHFTVRWPEWMPFFGEGGGEIFPPIFNVADAAITVGVIWIIVRQRTYFRSLNTHQEIIADVDTSEEAPEAMVDKA